MFQVNLIDNEFQTYLSLRSTEEKKKCFSFSSQKKIIENFFFYFILSCFESWPNSAFIKVP